MNYSEIDEVITKLKLVKGDTQTVEAKLISERKLSNDIGPTLSAFSNTHGGLLLLGIEEKDNRVTVKGLKYPKKIMDNLRGLATDQMVPPLRIIIDSVEYKGKVLVYCEVPEIDEQDKPCYVKKMV